jgi:hypothetical protein
MIIARLKVGAQSIDDIRLVIGGDQPTIINLKGQRSALNLWNALAKWYISDRKCPLTLNIDGIDYRFSDPVWSAIFNVVDQWFEEHLPVEYAELFSILSDEPPESAEIIPLPC